MCFLFSNGALAVSVAAFRNSVVFHRLDYTISLAIHALPMVTMINLRWNTLPYEQSLPLDQRRFGTLPDYSLMNRTEYMTNFFGYPSIWYFLWVLIYFPIVFYIKSERIKQ